MKLFRLLLLTAAAIVAVGLLPLRTFAAEPTVETMSGTLTQIIPADQSPCDFAIRIDTSGTVTIRTYYDQNGDPTRQLLYGPVTHTFSSLDVHGNAMKSLSTKGPAPAHTDLSTGLQTSTGDQMIFTLPGQGVIFGQAGNVVYGENNTVVVSSSGLDVQNLAALCSALTP